jgi:hypothetical protein
MDTQEIKLEPTWKKLLTPTPDMSWMDGMTIGEVFEWLGHPYPLSAE